MPGVEPQPAATLIAVAVLLSTVVSLWLRPWWLWIAGLSATILAGYVAGILDGPAGAAFVLLGFALLQFRGRHGWRRQVAAAVVVLVSLALALHVVPGFHNPVVIRDAVLSPGAIAYTQYANVDKGLAGVLILGTLGAAGSRGPVGAGARRSDMWLVVAATVVGAMAASLAAGYVRFDPRWTPLVWAWAPINLLLTCVSEEAFFRGFLQRELARDLERWRHGGAIAVGLCALLFGIAHAAGGWRYVLLATIAGTGYGVACQRSGRVEWAILTHFAVNVTHFLWFTYPSLA